MDELIARLERAIANMTELVDEAKVSHGPFSTEVIRLKAKTEGLTVALFYAQDEARIARPEAGGAENGKMGDAGSGEFS